MCSCIVQSQFLCQEKSAVIALSCGSDSSPSLLPYGGEGFILLVVCMGVRRGMGGVRVGKVHSR